MFSTLKQNLKFRITHLIYNIATTRYEAQSWTRTILCQNCQKMISIEAHFCMYCGERIDTTSSVSEVTTTTKIPPPHTDNLLPATHIQLQNTDPIRIEEVAALLSAQTVTRSFLQYARSHNGPPHSPQVQRHRQLQDRATMRE